MNRRTLPLYALFAGAALLLLPWLLRVSVLARSIPNDLENAASLDASINASLKREGLMSHLTSAVVPIVGYRDNAPTLRLAQIDGPAAAVNRVRAVLEIDGEAAGEHWQYTTLIPVASIADGGRGRRVDGVGVTAIITK
jgi:hypothetical protein